MGHSWAGEFLVPNPCSVLGNPLNPLPGPSPVGHVRMKGYLSSRIIFLSRTAGRHVVRVVN